MNTGNTSKSAFTAARIALLVGVSAAALGFAGSANAQTAYGDSTATLLPGIGWATIDSTNTYAAGTISGTLYANGPAGSQTVIQGSTLTSTDGGVNTTTVSPTSVSVTNGTTTSSITALGFTGPSVVTGQALIGTGGLVSLGQVQVGPSASGVTLNTNGTSTFNGLATFNGGTQTNGNAVVTGNTKTGSLTDTGNATVGGTATVTGQSFLNGGATVSGNLTATPGTNVNMGDNVVHDVATPIVGTDAANKAYVDKQTNRAFEGTAVALAISQPMFQPGQSFAVRAGWGDFESENAFGVSAAGVVARDVFGYGSTIVVDAGVGVGTNYNGVAGKAGVTIGFGGVAPLK